VGLDFLKVHFAAASWRNGRSPRYFGRGNWPNAANAVRKRSKAAKAASGCAFFLNYMAIMNESPPSPAPWMSEMDRRCMAIKVARMRVSSYALLRIADQSLRGAKIFAFKDDHTQGLCRIPVLCPPPYMTKCWRGFSGGTAEEPSFLQEDKGWAVAARNGGFAVFGGKGIRGFPDAYVLMNVTVINFS